MQKLCFDLSKREKRLHKRVKNTFLTQFFSLFGVLFMLVFHTPFFTKTSKLGMTEWGVEGSNPLLVSWWKLSGGATPDSFIPIDWQRISFLFGYKGRL